MRNIMMTALLVPLLALAGTNLTPVTVVDTEGSVRPHHPVAQATRDGSGGPPAMFVGTVDTVGGTAYDWQANGPAYRCVVNSEDYGLHVAWMYGADTANFPDRNIRYNFYDYALGEWGWVDNDFMLSGVNVYTDRVGYGNLDADPTTGVAFVSAHGGDPIHPIAARDQAPGAGFFEYSDGPDGYLWSYISVDQTPRIHCHMIDDATTNEVYYTKVDPWDTWLTPVAVAPPQPNPNFPNQNVGASKVSGNVCLTWEQNDVNPDPGYYRISTDGGANWGAPTELPAPAAYGGDTATSFHISSLFPFYDRSDGLHIVTSVSPVVEGSGYVIPAQIWHWSPDNSPNWSHITTAGCDPNNLLGAVGYNAIYATRPSIGEDGNGNLYVVWEQFDSSNVETEPPGYVRADIFAAGSQNNGQTWGAPVKLAAGGTASLRFPSIVDIAHDDTMLAVVYEIDLLAGFFVQGENAPTNNAVVCQWVPTSEIPVGIAESPLSRLPARTEVAAVPNPFGSRTNISYALPKAGNVSLVIYDATGRPVSTVVSGYHGAGRHNATWDATGFAAGIYFYTLSTDDTTLSEKLILVH